MPLTPNQYNDHVRQLALRIVQAVGVTDSLIVTAISYGKLGAEQREATLRFLKELYQAQFGVDPTIDAQTRHAFKHWVDFVASGEGVEA